MTYVVLIDVLAWEGDDVESVQTDGDLPTKLGFRARSWGKNNASIAHRTIARCTKINVSGIAGR